MEKKREIGLSKFLSLLLRHNPDLIGLSIDDKGWADVHELIEKSAVRGKRFDLPDLKYIVQNCDKQRYTFNDDYTKIRANQGHSIKVNLELEPTEPPEILFHGTAIKNLKSILENGIHSGTRNYVHLSQNIETATKVGMRHGKVIILEITSGKMFAEGINFYISKNNVWLTNFIDPKYIKLPDN